MRRLLKNPGRLIRFILSFFVGAFFIYLWQLCADLRIVSPVFLPGPDRAWAALVNGVTRGELGHQIVGTVERMLYGWVLASLLGVALGSMIGISKVAREYLTPMLDWIRPMPASAIVPVAISLLGLTDAMVLAVISFGALWPMLLATIHGFAAVEPRLHEVSRALGLSRWSVVWKIALPNAMPDILAGMRIGLTVSLILTVVGEMLGSRDGLGFAILLAARSFHSADLFAGVILFGIIGYISGQLMSLAERRLLRWRKTG
jgi:sulfonate transport system permease protein